MKALLIVILSLSFTLNSIGQAPPGTNSMTGKWHLIQFKNLKTGIIEDTSSIQNGWRTFYKNVKLNFLDSANVGKIWGTSFCNDVSGAYKIYDNGKLTSTGISGTQVGCLFEGKLWDAFGAASSFKRNNDTLLILYNNDSEEMVFIPYR